MIQKYYTPETAPGINKEMIGYLDPIFSLPYGHSPCDYYGNPYNPDLETVQCYVHACVSSGEYHTHHYDMRFNKN